jgi:hypothetical protein
MLLRPHDLKIIKEIGIKEEKDDPMIPYPLKVLYSERKANETITVVSLEGKNP